MLVITDSIFLEMNFWSLKNFILSCLFNPGNSQHGGRPAHEPTSAIWSKRPGPEFRC